LKGRRWGAAGGKTAWKMLQDVPTTAKPAASAITTITSPGSRQEIQRRLEGMTESDLQGSEIANGILLVREAPVDGRLL
jgi:hypothetical protein